MGQDCRPARDVLQTGMAASEQVFYQPYSTGKRGNLTPGKPMPCRTPEEAIRRAEKALAAGLIVGAHVVRVAVDADAGDWGDPEYLASFGAVLEPE